jgi:YndJ-like protein
MRFKMRRVQPNGGLVGGLGLFAWFAVIALEGPRLGVTAALLAVAPLVVIPLGFAAIRPHETWICFAAPAAVFALVLRASTDEVSRPAVVMASVWFLATFSIAFPAAWVWLRGTANRRFSLEVLLPLAAILELTTAAAWLVAATLRIELLGFSETIVLLTAVHFHFAGFGACVVTVTRMRNAVSINERKWAGRAGVLVLGASPVVAVGHLTIGALELLGGILLTSGVWIVSYLGWREAFRSVGLVRVLLIVGALSPVVSMLFALHYGLTRVSGLQPVAFSTIAWIHGGLNAFGFIIANLIAFDIQKSRR